MQYVQQSCHIHQHNQLRNLEAPKLFLVDIVSRTIYAIVKISGAVTTLSISNKLLFQLLPVDKYQLFQNGLELQHSAGRKDHFYSLI